MRVSKHILATATLSFIALTASAQTIERAGRTLSESAVSGTVSMSDLNNVSLIDDVNSQMNEFEETISTTIDAEIERLETLIDDFEPRVDVVWLSPPGGDGGGGGGGGGNDGGGGGGGGGGGSGGDCFAAGTMITLENGDAMPIEYVSVGQKLKSPASGTVTVVELDRPLLAERTLYRINNRLLLSPEHPILTRNGFKSINPEATARVNPSLKVNELKVGDIVKTLNGEESIKTIEPFGRKSDLRLYNFVLSGGNTFYADGFPVHNNFPNSKHLITTRNQQSK